MPQYLLLGTHGPEGQPCDFTALRVYTWGKQKERYETAFVESNVCGKFPILKSQTAGPEADLTFTFLDYSNGAADRRTYQMHQTIVRLAKDGNNVLVSLLEQQLLEATDRREAAVQGINAHIAFVNEAGPLLAQTTAQTTAALTTFRIP